MDTRLKQLSQWLTDDLAYTLKDIQPASQDASFRRYFRANTNAGTFIIMDAPPNKEPINTFIRAATDLAKYDVHTPYIHHVNQADGFLVLEDLGSRTYLDELENYIEASANDSAQQQDHPSTLYSQAINALIKIQSATGQQEIAPWPDYNEAKLIEEMDLFDQWFLQQHLSVTMSPQQSDVWQNLKSLLLGVCNEQPKKWVHRDYHSRNLMVTENNSPGVIDFQDMVFGPISYDLASLLKDCYIRWPREQQLSWLNEYYQSSERDFSFAQLIRWFDLTGLQRHLKVLGIFCRLHYRDEKDQYLKDLPLVADYIIEVIDLYDELSEFKHAFSDLIAN